MRKRGLFRSLFSKKGQVWDTLIPWIIAVAVLAVVLLIFFMLQGKGTNALDYLRDLWRFR